VSGPVASALADVAAWWAVAAGGTIAGTFFAVEVSVFPALTTMPAEQYVRTQLLLGKGYHPVMPILVSSVLVADAALCVLAPSAGVRALYAVALVLFAGVPAISQFGNLPLNKAIVAADAGGIPGDWTDPRPAWRAWHRVRLVLAFAVLFGQIAGLALVS
jgi:uncharacterized membrane protein